RAVVDQDGPGRAEFRGDRTRDRQQMHAGRRGADSGREGRVGADGGQPGRTRRPALGDGQGRQDGTELWEEPERQRDREPAVRGAEGEEVAPLCGSIWEATNRAQTRKAGDGVCVVRSGFAGALTRRNATSASCG